MDYIIEVDHISKCFKLTTEAQTVFRLLKRVGTYKYNHNETWALRDINFKVKRGEKIGIIGDNGSGKTTLIRIISRIYKQTAGTVKVNGEVSCFLHIGIGMLRDLSALDNIYLFGTILGMDRDKINKRLDSIIDFSELRDFIHCPLRDFSTGMYQRLAFSIAKEVDSSILLFDEIPLGGDIGFREKCIRVFEGYKNSDKTIITASHSIDAIERFCDRVLLLDKGRQIAFDQTKEVIDIYKSHKF